MYQSGGVHLPLPISSIGIAPLSCAESARSPIYGWHARTKRLIDIVIALVGLALFALPMLLAALLITLESPGPVLFRQRRIGLGNQSFEMLKFRTMYHATSSQVRLRQTCRHDPRVTRIGALLRRTSGDELPQLLNVLRGDMSIVGPRPHAPGTCAGGTPFELVTPYYRARHRVRPGLTGLAQVRGWRGETDTKEKLLHRLEADLEYIEHWSLWRDLTILARTVVSVLGMRNAY
jgi:polysaccharide biosynthesis protein PslA